MTTKSKTWQRTKVKDLPSKAKTLNANEAKKVKGGLEKTDSTSTEMTHFKYVLSLRKAG